MRNIFHKSVIINRAVPGSGKTSLSNCIVRHFRNIGLSVELHSTDDFFTTSNGLYEFQLEKLHEFHQKNIDEFIESLKSEMSLVICDNTNIAPWQTKPYTDAARLYGYRIVFLTYVPRELEKHIQSQQVTPDKPDAHCVPADVLVRFIEDYNIYSPLLEKSFPVNPEIHKDYSWDTQTRKRVETGLASPHFDADDIIEILPDQYHEIKNMMGDFIYNYLTKDKKSIENIIGGSRHSLFGVTNRFVQATVNNVSNIGGCT